MYAITKEQIAHHIPGSGIIEICPEGVVSSDTSRIMIVPHSGKIENGEVVYLCREQAEQLAKEFFPGGSIAKITGGECSHANITMNDDELHIGKLVSIGAPQNKPIPDWRKIEVAFVSEHKVLFDLDSLLDLLQRLKKSAGEKNLCVEIDNGRSFLSRIAVGHKTKSKKLRQLPYAYIMQCKNQNDAE